MRACEACPCESLLRSVRGFASEVDAADAWVVDKRALGERAAVLSS